MALRGSLKTMSITDVLEWIDRRSVAGALTVESGTTNRSFHYFDSGSVTGASSNLPGEHLGQLLLSRSLVSDEQLREAFSAQGETGVLLGKVLLMTGAVSESDLRDVLELKIRESMCDVLSWDAGLFLFERGNSAVSEVPVSVPLRTTIDLGAKQAVRWREIRKLISSDDMTFWVKDHFAVQDPGASSQVRDQVTRLVDCIERGLTVGQMILEHHGRRLQVCTHLGELVQRDAIAVDRRTESRIEEDLPASVELIEKAARSRVAGGDKIGALALVKRALETHPEDGAVQKLHKELERSLFAELSRELLGTFRVPRVLKAREELESLHLSDAEQYLMSRIDGRWDLLSLMRISPIREVEALLIFKKLADRGIISL